MTTQLVTTIFVVCCVKRVVYLMEESMVWDFVNGSTIQSIGFAGIFLYFLRPCSVFFLSNILNTKQINIKTNT